MTASAINPSSRRPRPSRPLIGPSSTILLLGFLAGTLVGRSIPAATMSWAVSLTLAGLVVSIVGTKISNMLVLRAARRACDRMIHDLERRMERLIPKRRMIAHGTHRHSPHNRDESESEWLPVARRSRSRKSRR